MDKKERQIAIIKNKISSCVKTTSAEVFCYGEIPLKRIQGAKSVYAYGADNGDILALIDTTVWGSGKRGMVFTTEGFYFKDMLEDVVYYKYTDFFEIPIPDNIYFDYEGLKNMLEELFELEWEEITDCLDEIETLVDFTEQIEEERPLSHTIMDILGDTAIEMLESWVDEKRKERDEADKAETDAVFEALYDIKNTLTLLIDSFKEVINTEIDLNDEEEVSQYFICLAMCAASFGSQYFSEEDWTELGLEEITEQDFYTVQKETSEFLEFLDSVFDEFEEDEIDFEKVSLKMASRLFAHKIDTILEEFQEDDVDMEELYQTALNETKVLRKQLKKVRRNINKIIEYGYKEQQELFCE